MILGGDDVAALVLAKSMSVGEGVDAGDGMTLGLVEGLVVRRAIGLLDGFGDGSKESDHDGATVDVLVGLDKGDTDEASDGDKVGSNDGYRDVPSTSSRRWTLPRLDPRYESCSPPQWQIGHQGPRRLCYHRGYCSPTMPAHHRGF